MQAAQQQVLEAIKTAAPERNFEANNYFPLVQVRCTGPADFCCRHTQHALMHANGMSISC